MSDEPEILEEFISDCKVRNMSPQTIRMYRSNVRRFLQQVQDYESAGEDELKQFLQYLKDEREVSYKTMVNYFSAISSFYEYLMYKGVVDKNPALPVRKRYLKRYKKDNNNTKRQVPEPKKLSAFINFIPSIRDKAIVLLFLKTGVRRNELIDIDAKDINWEEHSIKLKQKPKRSNTTVYFDYETAKVLKRWIDIRNDREPDTDALFIGEQNERLKRHGVYKAVVRWAEKFGLHDPDSDDKEDKFTPHTLRHVFTTYLMRNGMQREFIKELRGDTRGEALDIYHHIDHDELRNEYEGAMPELGIV